MMDFDQAEFLKGVAAIIREAVDPLKAENDSLRKEISELKACRPEKGDKGDPGDPAPPVEIDVADVVKELLAADQIKQLVGLEVESFLTENPPESGKDGADGPKGDDGKSVTLDDVSIFLDAAVATHVLDFERRANETLAKAIDKIPAPKDGRDGRDGADYSGAKHAFEGDRDLVIHGAGGSIRKRLDIPLWRGYWSPGVVAEKDDILTHNGTAYIAIADNPKCEPGVGKYDHEWKVFTRKGKDGSPGPRGPKGEPPAPVKIKPDNDDA